MTTIVLNDSQVAQLFDAHHEAILTFLTKRGCCPDTAQDLSQEAYLRLLCKNELGHDQNLKAYLFRIAERLAIDYLRQSRQTKNNTVPLDEDLICPNLPPDELVALRQQCRRLLHAIESMPGKYRTVFLLRKIDELSYAEIATRLGVSEKTVQRRLVNAMLHCHAVMENPVQ